MDNFVLVTGGTGTLGRHIVRRLRHTGRDVRVLSRGAHHDEPGLQFKVGDLLSGLGVDAAVAGVSTIIHCAGSGKGDDRATRNLVHAATRAGDPHLVYISVVGADRVPVVGRVDRTMFGYFKMKRKAEQIVANSTLPWTTLRATQFHDLVLFVAEHLAKLPIVPVPSGFFFQPIDADEVAEYLVNLALGRPAGLVPDIAGPRVYSVSELVRTYLDATDRHRLMVPITLPGAAANAIRAGANLAPERAVGVKTWEDFLAERLPPTASAKRTVVTSTRIDSRANAAMPH